MLDAVVRQVVKPMLIQLLHFQLQFKQTQQVVGRISRVYALHQRRLAVARHLIGFAIRVQRTGQLAVNIAHRLLQPLLLSLLARFPLRRLVGLRLLAGRLALAELCFVLRLFGNPGLHRGQHGLRRANVNLVVKRHAQRALQHLAEHGFVLVRSKAEQVVIHIFAVYGVHFGILRIAQQCFSHRANQVLQLGFIALPHQLAVMRLIEQQEQSPAQLFIGLLQRA